MQGVEKWPQVIIFVTALPSFVLLAFLLSLVLLLKQDTKKRFQTNYQEDNSTTTALFPTSKE